jgi:phosphatidylserine decarboxylase
MAETSSCIASKSIGDNISKGDHIGNFAYGGSSHVIIFQKQAKLSFSD